MLNVALCECSIISTTFFTLHHVVINSTDQRLHAFDPELTKVDRKAIVQI